LENESFFFLKPPDIFGIGGGKTRMNADNLQKRLKKLFSAFYPFWAQVRACLPALRTFRAPVLWVSASHILKL
jgi:hypothetical protein